MKKGMVALGVVIALCGFMSLDAKKDLCSDKVLLCEKGEKAVSCCNPTLIHSDDFEGCEYFIGAPGAYALAEDIVNGTIRIEANDVCLDLKRHTLSNSKGSPIIVSSQSNIQIKNGTIISLSSLDAIDIDGSNGIFFEDLFIISKGGGDGIEVSDSFNLCFKNLVFTNEAGGNCVDIADSYGMAFENLSFEDPTDTALRIVDSRDMKFNELRFFPVNQAMVFDRCSALCINGVDASKNTTTGDIIAIFDSQDITIKDVDASHCIVDRTASSTGDGIVEFSNSQRICMSCCTINNNECKDDQNFFPVEFFECSSVKIEQIEVNCNKVTNQKSSGEVNTFFIRSCQDFCVKDCQFNRSSVVVTNSYLAGLGILESQDILIDCCDINGTTIETFLATIAPFDSTGAFGLYVENSPVVTIRDTQVNHTTHLLNDKTGSSSAIAAAKGFFIQDSTRCRIEGCQANCTTIKAVSDPSATNDIALGFFIQGVEDLHICKSEAIKTFSAGDQAYGFGVYGFTGGPVTLSKCIASCTKAQKLAIGFATHQFGSIVNELTIEESCANDNRAERGYGFAFESTENSTISHAQAEGNTTSGFFLGRLLSGDFVENFNTQFIRNCAKNNGIGFLFESEEGKLITVIATLLVVENTALCNTACGFERRGDNIFGDSWIGNEAQGNNPDFCIDPIPFEEKKHGKASCKDTRGDTEENISFCGTRS